MVVCGSPATDYASCHPFARHRGPGRYRHGRLFLAHDPIRTECKECVHALPSPAHGVNNPELRSLRIDRLPFMLGESRQVPELQNRMAARGTRPREAGGLELRVRNLSFTSLPAGSARSWCSGRAAGRRCRLRRPGASCGTRPAPGFRNRMSRARWWSAPARARSLPTAGAR